MIPRLGDDGAGAREQLGRELSAAAVGARHRRGKTSRPQPAQRAPLQPEVLPALTPAAGPRRIGRQLRPVERLGRSVAPRRREGRAGAAGDRCPRRDRAPRAPPRPARPRPPRRPEADRAPSRRRPSGCAAPITPAVAARSSPGPPRARSARPATRATGPTSEGASSPHSRGDPRQAGAPDEARVALGARGLAGEAPAVAELLRPGRAGPEGRNAAVRGEQERHGAVARVPLAARAVGGADEDGRTLGRGERRREADGGEAVTQRRGQLERHDVPGETGQLGERLHAAALVVGR